ncbi:UNVERIFIED_CONTAM: hypothetical protein B566_EDAN019090, partial [Ephemera danica]
MLLPRAYIHRQHQQDSHMKSKEPQLRNSWTTFIKDSGGSKMDLKRFWKKSRLCSLHFTVASYYADVDGRSRLFEDAVPSKNNASNIIVAEKSPRSPVNANIAISLNAQLPKAESNEVNAESSVLQIETNTEKASFHPDIVSPEQSPHRSVRNNSPMSTTPTRKKIYASGQKVAEESYIKAAGSPKLWTVTNIGDKSSSQAVNITPVKRRINFTDDFQESSPSIIRLKRTTPQRRRTYGSSAGEVQIQCEAHEDMIGDHEILHEQNIDTQNCSPDNVNSNDDSSHYLFSSPKKCRRSKSETRDPEEILEFDVNLEDNEVPMNEQLEEVNDKVNNLLNEVNNCKFSILKFIDNDKKIKYYTGFESYLVFHSMYLFFAPNRNNVKYLGTTNRADDISSRPHEAPRRGPVRKMLLMDEFFMVLIRLRRGTAEELLGDMFCISQAQCSHILNTWIIIMSDKLAQIPIFPPKTEVERTTPEYIKKLFKGLRIIIDSLELFTQSPSSILTQREIFSSYKHHTTAKAMLGIAPSGLISYFTRLYAGRCSDKKILRHCGLLDLLEPNDVIMADRGFDIDVDVKERGISIITPAFLRGRSQFNREEVSKSRQLAQVRVHVERAVRKVKEFKILEGTIPISLVPMLDRIWTICVHLSNFTGHLIKQSTAEKPTQRRKVHHNKHKSTLSISLARLR